jgi:uncharacterized protein YoxC
VSAGDLAAVLVAISALVVIGLACVVVVSLRRTVDELDAAVRDLRDRLEPATRQLVETADLLADEAQRADGVLDTIDAISARSDALSRATFKAIAEPVIRTASVIRGTSRAGRRLRSRNEEEAS